MDKEYVVIYFSSNDGMSTVERMTQTELEKLLQNLADDYQHRPGAFESMFPKLEKELSSEYNTGEFGTYIIVRGITVVPEPVEVVTKYKI